MFFLSGAASSVLDFLQSLQGSSGTQQNLAVGTAASSQNPFTIPASTTTTSGITDVGTSPAGSTGNRWSSAETMNTLLSAQSQSAVGAAGGAKAADVLGNIGQLLNQIGAGFGTTGSGGASAMQGAGGTHHHHHTSGIGQLLHAFASPSGRSQGATNTDGSTANLAALGTGSLFSSSFPGSSDGTQAGTAALGLSAVNPLGRLMDLQARHLGAATAGGTLSTTA